MDTLAKGERLRGVRAPEIKRLWLWEDGGVAAGCGEPEEELCALRQVDVAEGDRPLCHAPPDWDGRVVTERLVDGTGDQLRVGGDRVPAGGILKQPANHVADQVVCRFVPGEGERVQDRADLLMCERLGILVVDRQQRAGKVVAACIRLCCDELAKLAKVRGHVLGVVHLFAGRRPSPSEAGAVATPILEPR